jgi:tRNA modification GTPase
MTKDMEKGNSPQSPRTPSPPLDQGDLIAAIGTATGPGAVAMIRLSGKGAHGALSRVFVSREDPRAFPRRLILGKIVSPETGELLDHALAAYFPGPNSFTGEDSVEIQGHGGSVLPGLTLEAVLRSGARLANPGEFTERAFLNGRISLDQAEAVAEIVASESEAEAYIAARTLDGALRDKIEPVSKSLLRARALLTAALDFEEEWNSEDSKKLLDSLNPIIDSIEELLMMRRSGRVYKDGLRVVLSGPPNAGKSSLFNALIGKKRALVSKIPGTTRDYLEAPLSFGKLKVSLIDTAGLRDEGADELELMGKELALEQIGGADIVLWLIDLSEASKESLLQKSDPPILINNPAENHKNTRSPVILKVYNKIDLVPDHIPPPGALCLSATEGKGLGTLKDEILRSAGALGSKIPEIVPNLRQELALEGSLAALRAARDSLVAEDYPEITSLLLQESQDSLDLITGRTATEELLTEVFSHVCLGQ